MSNKPKPQPPAPVQDVKQAIREHRMRTAINVTLAPSYEKARRALKV